MKRIVCFHLLNDYSGSPKVLRMVLEGLLRRGNHIDLVTSKGGVLDELDDPALLRRHSYPYRFSTNPALTALRYAAVQAYTFLLSFRFLTTKDCVFFINTLLPFGPALAARLMGKKVVYHYHENADAKGRMYQTLCNIMQRLAHKIICVSEYQASFLKRKDKVTVVPNALPDDFAAKMRQDIDGAFARKNVLMLSSLKPYKGTIEFIQLAKDMPQYQFTLVVNDTQQRIDGYLNKHRLQPTGNLTVYPRQADVTPFYDKASIVLNLSNKNLFVETFGLTALEAMTASLPVIVPTVGGIAEIVEDGENGYKIDVENLDLIQEKIELLLSDKTLYATMARKAKASSKKYGEVFMNQKIAEIIDV